MILRVCCKCGRWLGIRFGGWHHRWLSRSHGYCAECYQKEIEAIREA